MSTIKTRLKQKTDATKFDGVIYIASSSDIVARAGNEELSVEDSLLSIESTLPNKVNGQFRIYHGLSELSLTAGSETIQSIIEAMQNNSMLLMSVSSGNNTSAYPATNGTLLAVKVTQEFAMTMFQEVNVNSLHTGVYYKSVSTSQVTWTGWRDYEVPDLTYDNTPINGSDNLLTSGTIYTALQVLKTEVESYSDNADSTLQQSLNSTISSVNSALSTHTSNNTIHISSGERATWNAKQNALTVDSTPTSGSNNPVTSSGIKTALDGKSDTSHNHDSTYIKQSAIGAASGVVPLGSDSKISAQYLPSYVDDVIEGSYVSATQFNNTSGSPVTLESGKIYIDINTNKVYRYGGSTLAEIPLGVALGETSSTAYRGDRGKIAYDHSQTAITRSNTTASQTLANGGSFSAISTVTSNGGHVTAVQTKTFTLPTIDSGNKTVSQTSQPMNQSEGDLWFETIS